MPEKYLIPLVIVAGSIFLVILDWNAKKIQKEWPLSSSQRWMYFIVSWVMIAIIGFVMWKFFHHDN